MIKYCFLISTFALLIIGQGSAIAQGIRQITDMQLEKMLYVKAN